MGYSVKTVFDKTKKVAEGFKLMSSQRTMAGVPSDKGIRTGGDTDNKEPINNAALMYIHEFGAPEAGIPARPVIYPALKSIRKEIILGLRNIAKAALEGKPGTVDRGFHALGIIAAKAMQKRITEGPFVPLSPKTIYARAHRKKSPRNSAQPLIDFGILRRSLTYVIRKIV